MSRINILRNATINATSHEVKRAGRQIVKKLSIAIPMGASGEPPAAFRIFAAGVNTSTQGEVLFDEAAAKAVMAAYAKHGVAPIIDLEHLSLEDPRKSVNYDPDSRGSFELELRNGELWAVNVKWTEDGEQRLRARRQRYFSPAFITEDDGKGPPRVVEIINCALCAQPALDHLPPLIAANKHHARRAGVSQMKTRLRLFDMAADQEMLPQIAEAMGLDGSAPIADVIQAVAAWLKDMQDAVQGQQPPADGGDSPLGDGDGDEGDPAAMRAAMARRIVDELGAIAGHIVRGKVSDKALVAFRASVLRDTNATTTEEATETLQRWRDDSRSLSRERKRIADERAELEAKDRHDLAVELVRLRALTPAQVWEKDAEGVPQGPDEKKGTLGKPSALMRRFTLAELREIRDDSKKPGKSARTPSVPDEIDVPTENHAAVEVVTFTGEKRVIELSDREVQRFRDNHVKKYRAQPTEEQLKAYLVRYATMKANTEVKAGKKAV